MPDKDHEMDFDEKKENDSIPSFLFNWFGICEVLFFFDSFSKK